MYKFATLKKIKDKSKRIFNNKLNPEKRSFNSQEDITLEELKKNNTGNVIIIDVRNRREFLEGHLQGAINIFEYDIDKLVPKKFQDKNQKIIVYCSSGKRSKIVQKRLKKMGYINVYNLYMGMEHYKK